jgi:hypothetical protein
MQILLRRLVRLLFLVLLLISIVSISIYAQTKVNGIAQKGGKAVKTSSTTTYKLMETYPSCTVTVYLANTITLATIYSDTSGTLKSNPFTANSDASYNFYVNAGIYDIKFSGTGITSPFTISGISATTATGSLFPVEAYGALCDNAVTDDRIAFQSAVAAYNAAGGGIISVPNKKCLVGGTGAVNQVLLLTKAGIVRGAGGASQIIWKSDIPNTVNGLVYQPATTNDSRLFRIEDLQMYAQSGSPLKYAVVLDCVNAFIANFHLSNFIIGSQFGIGAIWLKNATHRLDGIFLGTINNNSLFVGKTLFDYVGDSVNIDHSTFTGTGDFEWTQLPSPAAGGSVIAKNSFTNSAIRIRSALKLSFRDNQIEYQNTNNIGSNTAMLDLNGDIGAISDTSITGNIFRGAGAGPALNGIRLGNTSRTFIEDNTWDGVVGKSLADVSNSSGFFYIGQKNVAIGSSTSTLNNPFSKPYFNTCMTPSLEWVGFVAECQGYQWFTNLKATNLTIGAVNTVPNLNTSPITYDGAGNQILGARQIINNVTLSVGTATVTLNPAYTSTSTYNCVANYGTTSGAPQIVKNTGSSVTFNGSGSNVVYYFCSGN